MKPSSKFIVGYSLPKNTKKVAYRITSMAIQKKLAEIKQESGMPAAVNNNLSLFRYAV